MLLNICYVFVIWFYNLLYSLCKYNFKHFSSTGPGTSSDPCSDRYRGPEAFSEVETRALRDAIERVSKLGGDPDVKDNDTENKGLLAYFSIQSYGQLVQAPWSGRDMVKPEDYDYLV